jgi:DNA polymerase II
MTEYNGWLLDLYADLKEGITLWLLEDNGRRCRLHQSFPVTFYAAGPTERLRTLWCYLRSQPLPVKLRRTERRELAAAQPLTVLEVQIAQVVAQPRLFSQAAQAFPDLAFFDADLPISLRHAAIYGTFPLARCQIQANEQGEVQALTVLDTPWELDPSIPPLRILSLEPNTDPAHARPTYLIVRSQHGAYRLSLKPARPLLVNLCAILERHDPDLLLTTWGDTWLIPHLLELSERWHIPLPLNRDAGRQAAYRPEHTYFSYGQIIYRGQQVHLFGRWHVDGHNAMLFHDYGMEGILELARVTALPVQNVARVSPGSGISAMQMITALRRGILVPWHKQQAENLKTALELLHADQGGLVYQPVIGLHSDVAEIDFISMYPSIMARFNVSPETVGVERPTAELVPELGAMIDRGRPGLIPQTLTPLLEKRIAFKTRLATLPAWDPRRKAYKARSSAHKWLLVTCFGYLGYKNARFGRIEAHEAVTAYGREALLRAKEAAEDMGFHVLHMYVDGLWVKKEGASKVNDFQPLLDEIAQRTSLPIALDGIYRWVAFLPSRVDERVPVPNRYFGVFQDGSLKIRGIEARRRDTPLFIVETQMAILELMAHAPRANELSSYLPDIVRLVRRRLAALRASRVPLEHLLVSQKLSRDLEEYHTPSPAARSARQLAAIGKTIKPGQRVRFLYMRGEPGVHAWDLPEPPNPSAIDAGRYTELMLRAVATVLEIQGVDEAMLRNWLHNPWPGLRGDRPPCQLALIPQDRRAGTPFNQPAKVSMSSLTSPPTG